MRSIGLTFPEQRSTLCLALLALTLLGCRNQGADIAAPAYGEARCATCRGVITDAHFAAQYRLPDGSVQSFDDPACLFEALRGGGAAPNLIRFHDHGTDSWIDGPTAWFARTPATTAHGSGWAAYPSFAAAQDAVTAAGSGEILSFEQARATLRRPATP